jgi:hypothetical protein
MDAGALSDVRRGNFAVEEVCFAPDTLPFGTKTTVTIWKTAEGCPFIYYPIGPLRLSEERRWLQWHPTRSAKRTDPRR